MSFRLKLFRTAVREVDQILDWLIRVRKVPAAAKAWHQAYERAISELRELPERFPFAPENATVDFDVRHMLFKTRRGRPYRLLFTIVGNEVRILHVRGPGQDLVPAEKLAFGDGA